MTKTTRSIEWQVVVLNSVGKKLVVKTINSVRPPNTQASKLTRELNGTRYELTPGKSAQTFEQSTLF